MELAALAPSSDPRVERAVTLWSRLAPAQRDRITVDQLAHVAVLPARELFLIVVVAGFESESFTCHGCITTTVQSGRRLNTVVRRLPSLRDATQMRSKSLVRPQVDLAGKMGGLPWPKGDSHTY